jgi:hypothetical protein
MIADANPRRRETDVRRSFGFLAFVSAPALTVLFVAIYAFSDPANS